LGAVEEVPTRVLREQLGERLVAQSGADFSAPLAAPPVPSAPQARDDARGVARPKPANEKRIEKRKDRTSPDHAWRAHEVDRPGKKLRRKFHGSRISAEPRRRPGGEARESLLTDRKGRPIPVERYGQPPAAPEPPRQAAPKRGRHRRATDRASGPRPRHPKGKR
jgi:23S rRNA pseudouridine2605 synthase